MLLRKYVKQFSEEIRRAGAKPALYMVWPSMARRGDFDRVIESHQLAIADVDGILLPVGAAWQFVLRNHSLQLYSADNFHPSALGSYLAAWVIFKQLYSKPNVSIPTVIKIDSKTISLTSVQATALSLATDETLR
jgi:hypothetical protein